MTLMINDSPLQFKNAGLEEEDVLANLTWQWFMRRSIRSSNIRLGLPRAFELLKISSFT